MCIFCLIKGANPLETKYPMELPPCELTFFLPDITKPEYKTKGQSFMSQYVDAAALRFLPHDVSALNDNGAAVVPIKTEGDGNCLPRAISRFIWGSEFWHKILREKMARELEENDKFYKSFGYEYEEEEGKVQLIEMSDEDWNDCLKRAQTDSEFLNATHILALCHVLKRPIILYCSEQVASVFGHGASGTASGTYIPLRFDQSECIKTPVVIAWSGKELHHFVPLVGMENRAAPLWPLAPAGYRKFQDRLADYVSLNASTKFTSTDHPVFAYMDEYLRKREQEQEELLDLLKSAGLTDDVKRKHRHPDTGELFDEMLQVGRPPATKMLGFNVGDDLKAVQDRFFEKYPNLESLRGQVDELMRETLAARVFRMSVWENAGLLPQSSPSRQASSASSPSSGSTTALTPSGSSSSSSLATSPPPSLRDGMSTKTPGVCDCGFKHVLGDREVDFVILVPMPGFTQEAFGWDFGDDIFETFDAWMNATEVRRAAQREYSYPAYRYQIIKRLILKETVSLRTHFVRMSLERDNAEKVEYMCPSCRSPILMGKYEYAVVCKNCNSQRVRPGLTPMACPSCGPEAPIPYLPGQPFLLCELCHMTWGLKSCTGCSARNLFSVTGLSGFFPCSQCKKWQPAGVPETLERIEVAPDGTKRKFLTFPVLATRQYTEVPDRRPFDTLMEFNAKMAEGLRLSDDELRRLGALQQAVTAKQFQSADVTAAAPLLTGRLLDWPPEQLFPVLDVLRAVLLNASVAQRVSSDDAVIAKMLTVRGNDWRSRFAALKCVCNLQMMMTKKDGPASMLRFMDRVLESADCAFNMSAQDPKSLSLVAAAGAVFNLSTAFAPHGGATGSEDQRNQLLMSLLLFLSASVRLRKDVLAEGLSNRARDGPAAPPRKEWMAHFERVEEVLLLLLQSFGNVVSGYVDRDALSVLCTNMQLEQSVAREFMASDPAVFLLFPPTGGVPVPRPTKMVRWVLRDALACFEWNRSESWTE